MAGRGEYQKQMTAILAAAKAKDLDFEDILPEEMLEHFHEMTELQAARELIRELEARENELRTANEALTKEVHKKQEEIDDLPEGVKALELELKQAQRQIKLHKEVAEDARERAERYQRQLKEIASKRQADISAADKIEHLQTEVKDQQDFIAKLVEDHRAAETISAQLRESDLEALAKKDKQLAKKDKELTEKDELLAKIREEAEEIKSIKAELDDACSGVSFETETLVEDLADDTLVVQQENIELLQRNLELEQRTKDLEGQLTATKLQLNQVCSSLAHEQFMSSEDRKARLSAALLSELKPLNRFYKSVFLITDAYAKIFHATSEDDIPSLDYVRGLLDITQNALDDYWEVNKLMRSVTQSTADDMDQTALHKELDALAESAYDSQLNLEGIQLGFWSFLNQLSEDPKMLSNLNGVLCAAPRLHMIELISCD